MFKPQFNGRRKLSQLSDKPNIAPVVWKKNNSEDSKCGEEKKKRNSGIIEKPSVDIDFRSKKEE